MLVIFCAAAAFVSKSSCLVARIVLFDTAGLHLLTFRVLEPYPSKDIELIAATLSQVNDVIMYNRVNSYLNQCFQAFKLLKYDGNIVIT